MIPFICLGIIGGAMGALFIRLNLKMNQIRKNPRYFLKKYPVFEVSSFA